MRGAISIRSAVTAGLVALVVAVTGLGIRNLVPGVEAEFDRLAWQRFQSSHRGRHDIADILASTAPQRGDWPSRLRKLGFLEGDQAVAQTLAGEGARVFRKAYHRASTPGAPRAGRIPHGSGGSAPRGAFDAVVILAAPGDGGGDLPGVIVAELRRDGGLDGD